MRLKVTRYNSKCLKLFASRSGPLHPWHLHIRGGIKRHTEKARMVPVHDKRMGSRRVQRSRTIIETIHHVSNPRVNLSPSYSSMWCFLLPRRSRWCLQSKKGQTCWWRREEEPWLQRRHQRSHPSRPTAYSALTLSTTGTIPVLLCALAHNYCG